MDLAAVLQSISPRTIPILDRSIALRAYTSIDLSVNNLELTGLDLASPTICQTYVNRVLKESNAMVAYGGYLEYRKLYALNHKFSPPGEMPRNVHLGIDFWTEANTGVLAPLSGSVHSYQNNSTNGDYGPTIIVKHTIGDFIFYTLYGHLSLRSLEGLYVGKKITKGEVFAHLGTTDVNVGYAPHLHFQIIGDIGSYQGDYPGVCTTMEVAYYAKNCPNPNSLLKI